MYTDRGDRHHEHVDDPGASSDGDVRIERALPLSAPTLGLHGVADVVEFYGDGTILPVEHKVGRRAQRNADDVQVAAQAMALEEMFEVAVPMARIYHHASRRRRDVRIDGALRKTVHEVLKKVRFLWLVERLPEPVNDSRCPECSLIDICLPDELDRASTLQPRDPTFDPNWR